MSYFGTNQGFNFLHQGNLQRKQSYHDGENRSQIINRKTYLNPQIVNHEFIKKSLSENCLRGSNKIHVNPNFRGNVLGHGTNKNYENLINMAHLNCQNKLLCKPGTSNINNFIDEKCNTNSSLAGNEKNLTAESPNFNQSRFKKNSAVNLKKHNRASYFWSNAKIDKEESIPCSKKTITAPDLKQIEKFVNFNDNQNVDEHILPKNGILQTCKYVKNHSIYKSKTKIINESKIRLLNNNCHKTKLCMNERIQIPHKKHFNLSKFVYNKNKKLSVLKVANAVRSKYKYLNNFEQYKKSKYKIIKRNKLTESVKKKYKTNTNKVKDIRRLFPNYFYNKVKLSSYNIYNVGSCNTSKNSSLWRINQSSDKLTKKIINQFQNKRIVKIGGILYKSTTNKLTLASKKVESSSKKALISKSKAKKNHVVYVRGEKFILENNGKALIKQSEGATSDKTVLLTPRRIDIGGVTYLQKSDNVLVRTNVHQARLFVNKAKNKSIALLAKLHKRSSVPCMIYHRFGRCIRHSKGLCMYKHDPKNIAVCKKFLKGNCSGNNCLLSHQVIQEKMAICHFFLKGFCIRENCPYLHVKLNKNAAICENFLQGYCSLGKECLKRHSHQCPEFDKYGTCKLGSKCHYPHKKPNKVEETSKEKVTDSLNMNDSDNLKDQSESVKYYVHSHIPKKQRKNKASVAKLKEGPNKKVQKKATKNKGLSLTMLDQSSSAVECFPKRIKLDKLPCFIPLNLGS